MILASYGNLFPLNLVDDSMLRSANSLFELPTDGDGLSEIPGVTYDQVSSMSARSGLFTPECTLFRLVPPTC